MNICSGKYLYNIFFNFFIKVQLIYNILLVSDMQHSDSVIFSDYITL